MATRLTYGIILILACLFPLSPALCLAGFDTDDDAVEMSGFDTDDTGPESFDADEFEPDTGPAPESPQASGAGNRLIRFLDQSTWTLAHVFSLQTGSDPEVVNNHLYLRQVSESLLWDRYFTRLDWKARMFPKTDHRADAKEKNVFLDGDLREAYVQAGFANMNLKLGSQIIVWGKADTVAVTDVASPRDNSEFIFPELEDMRFGQWAVSTQWFGETTNLFAFASPLPETDRAPKSGTHYFRPLLGDQGVDIVDQCPSFGDLEAGLKLEILSGKTEFSLMGGRFFANSPVYDDRGYTSDKGRVFHETYEDYTMAGAALSHVWNNLLFKAELAGKFRFPLQAVGPDNALRVRRFTLADTALGLEYNANDRYQIQLEIANRHLFDSPHDLARADTDRTTFYLTLTKDFFHDTLDLEYNVYCHLQDRDRYHNVRAVYDLTDAVELRFQFTLFNAGDTDGELWPYRREDRLSFEIRYTF